MLTDQWYLDFNFIFLLISVSIILALILIHKAKIKHMVIICLVSNTLFLYWSISPLLYLRGRLEYLLNYLSFDDVMVNGINQTCDELIYYIIPLLIFFFCSALSIYYISRIIKKQN